MSTVNTTNVKNAASDVNSIILKTNGDVDVIKTLNVSVVRATNNNAVFSETGVDKSGQLRLSQGTDANNEYVPLLITQNNVNLATFSVTSFGSNSKVEMGGGAGGATIILNSNGGTITASGALTCGPLTVHRGDGVTNVLQCSSAGNVVFGANSDVVISDGNITATGNLTYGDYIVSDGETQTLQNDAGIYLREDGLGTNWNVRLLNNGTATIQNQSNTGTRTVVFRIKDKAGTDVMTIDNDAIVMGGNFNPGSDNGKGYLLYQESGVNAASIQVQSPTTSADNDGAFIVRRGQTVPYVVQYDGSVISTAVTLTLSSGNLNVGDRLKKADDALKALKITAAAASDFAALKAAVVAALANI